jgi:hypothetical protein
VWLPHSIGCIRKLCMFRPCAQIPITAICYCLRRTQSKINRNGVWDQTARIEGNRMLPAQGFCGKHEEIRTRYNEAYLGSRVLQVAGWVKQLLRRRHATTREAPWPYSVRPQILCERRHKMEVSVRLLPLAVSCGFEPQLSVRQNRSFCLLVRSTLDTPILIKLSRKFAGSILDEVIGFFS